MSDPGNRTALTAPRGDGIEGAPPGVTHAQVEAFVSLLRRIPDAVREFTQPAEWAWERLRISRALLAAMRGYGLSHDGDGDDARYDRQDLMNAAMHLGCGPVARASRRFWPAALRRAADQGSVRYELRFESYCPEPGHDDACRYTFSLPGGAAVECAVPAGSPGPRLRTEVTVSGRWPEIPPRVSQILDEVADVEFLLLPDPLRYDVEFVRQSRLGDCAGVTRVLTGAARKAGLVRRASYGLLVAPPFATSHYFAEFLIDDVWVPVDPVLIRALSKWGVLDPAEWSSHRSLGSILCRLGDYETWVARHGDFFLDITVPTRLVTAHEPAAVR